MKYLSLILFITLNAQATTLTKYRSTPDGTASQKFDLSSGTPRLEKTSNYFDLTSSDYGIGVHELSSAPKEYADLVKQLEELSAKFKSVDEFLKTKNSSFNELAGVNPHEPVLFVNDYRVNTQSKYYAEVDAIFKKLRAMDWKLIKGYRISEDLKKVLEIDNGKTIKTSTYARDLYCQNSQLPTTCTFYGGGQVYVK